MPTQVTSENFAANTIVTYAEWTGSLIPKVSNVTVANSSYTILDDTAVSTNGGYVVITGTGFENGATVIINEVTATAVSFINSSTLHVQVPAKSAATYDVYVVNPDGATAIGVNKLTYSSTPTWVTDTTLTGQSVDTAFNITFDATGATSYSNTTALPAGTELLSNGYFYGTVTGIVEETTYNFTIRATDAENQDSDKNFSLTVSVALPAPTSVEYLVVAGGGGAGYHSSGGGGGGGGFRTGSLSVSSATPYTVTVGSGGTGGTSSSIQGTSGTSSVFSSITSAGGGGGSHDGVAASSGGSGGGGGLSSYSGGGAGGSGNTPAVSPSQGNNGGSASGNGSTAFSSGGGGGAGGSGQTYSPGTTNSSDGGLAASSSISGTLTYYAGGGGAGKDMRATAFSRAGYGGDTTVTAEKGGAGDGAVSGGNGGAGVVNTGGGGGSGSYGNPTPVGNGGNGGSGVVIIRYADTYADAASTSGSPTFTTTGGYKIYKFTGSGSITW